MNFSGNDFSNSFCGSPEYMSPEMLLKGSIHNHMIDYYSLGCLLYEMLVGIPPYYSNDRNAMYQNKINASVLEFPKDICKDAKNLIKGLL